MVAQGEVVGVRAGGSVCCEDGVLCAAHRLCNSPFPHGITMGSILGSLLSLAGSGVVLCRKRSTLSTGDLIAVLNLCPCPNSRAER